MGRLAEDFNKFLNFLIYAFLIFFMVGMIWVGIDEGNVLQVFGGFGIYFGILAAIFIIVNGGIWLIRFFLIHF